MAGVGPVQRLTSDVLIMKAEPESAVTRALTKRTLATLGLATAVTRPASAAPGPWSTKQFLDKLEAGSIERVVFSSDGKQIVATDTEGDSHPTLILPEQAVE